MTTAGPLVDSFGRAHSDLRISVTDRCNLRCRYCMPAEGVPFRRHEEILSFEEIERFVRVAAGMGIRQVRLTGGEPLVRKHVCRLVEKLAAIEGVEDLAMTTNGILLGRYAEELKRAGLDRLNVSLDTLDREKFARLSRCDELPRVLEGIAAARRAGFRDIKLNALAIRGQIEEDVAPLARFAREQDLQLRFIEFMPLDGDCRWSDAQVLPGEEILEILAAAIGPLDAVEENGAHAPASEYRFLDGRGRVGVISGVSKPFCSRCSRLRLSAEGKVHNCLFSNHGWDIRALLRRGASDAELAGLIRQAVAAKTEARGSGDGSFPRPARTMHQIGG